MVQPEAADDNMAARCMQISKDTRAQARAHTHTHTHTHTEICNI